jgi:hypothetical protein
MLPYTDNIDRNAHPRTQHTQLTPVTFKWPVRTESASLTRETKEIERRVEASELIAREKSIRRTFMPASDDSCANEFVCNLGLTQPLLRVLDMRIQHRACSVLQAASRRRSYSDRLRQWQEVMHLLRP